MMRQTARRQPWRGIAQVGLALVAMLAFIACGTTSGRADETGRFDYYVLSLSWSPSYCARAGRSADPMQCRSTRHCTAPLTACWTSCRAGASSGINGASMAAAAD